jgi:hypothetical protein
VPSQALQLHTYMYEKVWETKSSIFPFASVHEWLLMLGFSSLNEFDLFFMVLLLSFCFCLAINHFLWFFFTSCSTRSFILISNVLYSCIPTRVDCKRWTLGNWFFAVFLNFFCYFFQMDFVASVLQHVVDLVNGNLKINCTIFWYECRDLCEFVRVDLRSTNYSFVARLPSSIFDSMIFSYYQFYVDQFFFTFSSALWNLIVEHTKWEKSFRFLNKSRLCFILKIFLTV